jgi:hypothetical protein
VWVVIKTEDKVVSLDSKGLGKICLSGRGCCCPLEGLLRAWGAEDVRGWGSACRVSGAVVVAACQGCAWRSWRNFIRVSAQFLPSFFPVIDFAKVSTWLITTYLLENHLAAKSTRAQHYGLNCPHFESKIVSYYKGLNQGYYSAFT